MGLGAIEFIGETHFAGNTIIYGLSLDEPKGKNDGSKDNKKYFTARKKHGLFCTKDQIIGVLAGEKEKEQNYMESQEKEAKEEDEKEKEEKEAKTKRLPVNSKTKKHLKVGIPVETKEKWKGILKFVGKTHFAGDTTVYGVDLDPEYAMHGLNDGSKDGIRYFKTRPLPPHILHPPPPPPPRPEEEEREPSRIPQGSGIFVKLDSLRALTISLEAKEEEIPLTNMEQLKIGQKIKTKQNGDGYIRFIGTTLFSVDKTVYGIELE